MSSRMLLFVAAVLGALGIAIGAFGAHSLPKMLAGLSESQIMQRQEWLETGSRYHMYHVVALLVVSLASEKRLGRFSAASIAWILGILIFSGCLYTMSLTGNTWLGRIVPIGGLSFIVGWVLLAVTAWRRPTD